MTEEEQKQPEEKTIATVDKVIDYLVEGGWSAKKATVYRHRKEGKFSPRDNGQFQQKDIDRYAKTWLKRESTGKKVKDLEDELQRQILEEELATSKEKRKKIERENSRAAGELIDRREVESWLAGRAIVLDAGLRHWIQSRVADWIRTTNGDLKKTGELINMMIRDLDEHINDYAQAKEFEVVIDGEEFGTTPMTISVLPQAVQVLVPDGK